MSIQTALRLFLVPVIFSIMGLLTAFLTGDLKGWYALLIGAGIGGIVAKLHAPSLQKQWARTGMPGDKRTTEQQERWEHEKSEKQVKRNLSILFGLIVAAILRTTFREFLPFVPPIAAGGLATYIFCVGWLIYRKRGKLGP